MTKPAPGRVRVVASVEGDATSTWEGALSSLDKKEGTLSLRVGPVPLALTHVGLKMLSGQARVLGGGVATGLPPASAVPAGPTIQPGEWVDLLPLVDPEKDTIDGLWGKEDGRLVAKEAGNAVTAFSVPVAPEGDYTVAVEFAIPPDSSMDFSQGLFLPGGHAAWVTLKHASAGLSYLDGKQWQANGTQATLPEVLASGRPHGLLTTVRRRGTDEVLIESVCDGKKVFTWQGKVERLDEMPGFRQGFAKRLNIVAWKCRPVVTALRLKMLSGEARLLRPANP